MYSNGADIDTDFAVKVLGFSCDVLNINQIFSLSSEKYRSKNHKKYSFLCCDGCRSCKFNLLNS